MSHLDGSFGQDLCESGLNISRHFARITGMEALRPEAKILFYLGSRGAMSVKTAMSISGLSYRGFYAVLGRLEDNGLIAIDQDEKDKRVRRISLRLIFEPYEGQAPALPTL